MRLHSVTSAAVTKVTEDAPARDWNVEYERHAPQLVRYATRLLGSREDAADIVHDAFIAALKSPQLRDDDAFIPWLYRIVSNRAISAMRRKRLLRFVGLERAGFERAGSDLDERAHTVMLVRAALRELPSAQAITLVLAHHEGFGRAEIAEITGVPVATVKTRLARGRRAFHAAYHRLGGGTK